MRHILCEPDIDVPRDRRRFGAGCINIRDPILSVVNLIDVFLVVIAALLVAIAQNPANPFTHDDVTIIPNPGKPDMEIVSRQGEKVVRYQPAGQRASGLGRWHQGWRSLSDEGRVDGVCA